MLGDSDACLRDWCEDKGQRKESSPYQTLAWSMNLTMTSSHGHRLEVPTVLGSTALRALPWLLLLSPGGAMGIPEPMLCLPCQALG